MKFSQFQFPSSGEVQPNLRNGAQRFKMRTEFQFPSSGKVHPNIIFSVVRDDDYPAFQFPSMGKVHPNALYTRSGASGDEEVSIPFNREGTSKQIQQVNFDAVAYAFQFPSTGKVHPNLTDLASISGSLVPKCFNSLQSGRYIQTSPLRSCAICEI